MKIEITEERIIICDGLVCDPLALWDCSQHCGNCPMIAFAERFWTNWVGDFDTPLFEGDGNDSKAL